MYKVLLAALVSLVVSMQAFAANSDDYTPEYKAYASFSFGAPQAQSLGLHYGLRMDHDSREQSLFGSHKPAIAQVDFSSQSGFESAHIYGMPLTAPAMLLNETDERSKTEKVLWFSGWFLLGGIVYGIHELTRNNDSTPAAAPPAPGGGCPGGPKC